MNQFHGKHYWWDNNLDQQIHSRVLGELSLERTHTKLRVGYDVLKNYTYFGIQNDRTLSGDNYLVQHNQLNVRQSGSPISLLTLQLQQNLRFGIFNWENVLTLQKSSKDDILPVPTFNAYSNLFIRFRIAGYYTVISVLICDISQAIMRQNTYLALVLLVSRRLLLAVRR